MLMHERNVSCIHENDETYPLEVRYGHLNYVLEGYFWDMPFSLDYNG